MGDSLFDVPPVHPFVECPNCHELLEFGAPLCPRCREEISPEYAVASATIVHHNTQAVSFANTITTLNALIPLALIGTAVIYVIGWLSSRQPRIPTGLLFLPAVPLIAINIWYLRFGRFRIGDEEYVRARREMRRSFAFWLVFLIVDVLLVIVT
jgi:hypothetical protein